MVRRLRLWFAVVVVVLASLAVPSFAAPQRPFSSNIPLFSDFDGDSKIDQAELISNGAQKHIQVSFGSLSWKSLSFDSGVQDRGRLLSDDVDRDGDTDLVWVSQTWPRTYVTWLGDGRGNFSRASGDDRDQLKTFLSNDSKADVTGDIDCTEDDSPLQTPHVAALKPITSLSYKVLSNRRARLTQPVAYVSICLSALWKRGPPSQSS